MSKWLKIVRTASLAIILAVFGMMLFFADLGKIAQAFIGIKWGWAIWVPVLNLANTFVEGLRLAIILLPLTERFDLRNCFNSTLVGILGNIMLPLRLGDGARAYYISKAESLALSSSLSALMLDRIADFLSFFVIMAITAALYPFPPSIKKMGMIAGLLFVIAILEIFALAGLGSHIGGNSAGKIRRRVAAEISNFLNGFAVMLNAGLLFPIIIASALSWLMRASMIWFMFQAFSLNLPLIATPITLILLNFGIAVVSTPANLGGFELAIVGALSQLFSVEIEIALSYAAALHVIEVAPMVAFGTIFLWLEGFKTFEVLKTAKGIREER